MRADVEFGTIPRLVHASATRFSERDGLVDGDARSASPSWPGGSTMPRRTFIAAGIEPGDRVAIWAPNISEWVVAALGALGAGGGSCRSNTRFKGAEAGYVLTQERRRILCTVSELPRASTTCASLAGGEELPARSREIVALRGIVAAAATPWR